MADFITALATAITAMMMLYAFFYVNIGQHPSIEVLHRKFTFGEKIVSDVAFRIRNRKKHAVYVRNIKLSFPLARVLGVEYNYIDVKFPFTFSNYHEYMTIDIVHCLEPGEFLDINIGVKVAIRDFDHTNVLPWKMSRYYPCLYIYFREYTPKMSKYTLSLDLSEFE